MNESESSYCPDHPHIKEMAKQVKEIHEALVGTMDKPGWLTRIAKCEDGMSTLKRVTWASLATFFTGTMIYIWKLISHTN
jgi:hypothetical protein